MDNVRFILIAAEDLVQTVCQVVANDPSVNATVRYPEDAQKHAFRLGLVEAAAVVAIIANAIKLVETSVKVASAIIAWVKNRPGKKNKVIIQGEHEDTLLEIDASWTIEQLAKTIQNVATK